MNTKHVLHQNRLKFLYNLSSVPTADRLIGLLFSLAAIFLNRGNREKDEKYIKRTYARSQHHHHLKVDRFGQEEN